MHHVQKAQKPFKLYRSGTVLERLFHRALDAKGNIIFCIKSSLILNKYLEFSLECAFCMRHVCIYVYIYMKTLLCVISPICCKLSCYDDVGFFAKEKCEKSKKLNVK